MIDHNQRCGSVGKLAEITALSTSDAANTRTPSASGRMMRNSDAVTCFAAVPKRRLSNSYAVSMRPAKYAGMKSQLISTRATM
jgi:hypothetical protein